MVSREKAIKKWIYVITICIILIIVYHPARHARNYEFIKDEHVLDVLIPYKSHEQKTNLKDCNYEDIVLKSVEIIAADVFGNYRFHLPRTGGEYFPEDCNPKYKSAIIVPYRNRREHLNIFLSYMHAFLQNQKIYYKIFIVEQNDQKPFNRAKMLNYGAHAALKDDYDCLVLQDVDLLPITSGNMYACANVPRHMSSCLDVFRFNLPYLGLFGGAMSIRSQQFQEVNGFSNMFFGWGGEDDDFFMRLQAANMHPIRFSPSLSKYTMLRHRKEKPSEDRFKKLKSTRERWKADGLNTLNANYSLRAEPLFTHILAS